MFMFVFFLFIYLFHVDVKEIRGIGLQVSKLESAEASKKGICFSRSVS